MEIWVRATFVPPVQGMRVGNPIQAKASVLVVVLLAAVIVPGPSEAVDVEPGAIPAGYMFDAAVTVGNRIFLLGGLVNGQVHDEIWSFNPLTFQFQKMEGRLPAAMYSGHAFYDGQFIWYIHSTTVAKYDPLSDALIPVEGTVAYASGSSSSSYDGTHAYTFGQCCYSDAIYRFDPATVTTTYAGSLPSPRHHTAAASDGQYHYIFGGQNRDSQDGGARGFREIVRFDPVTGTAVNTGHHLDQNLQYLHAQYVNGAFYVFGGRLETWGGGTTGDSTVIYRYDGQGDPVRLPESLTYSMLNVHSASATWGSKIYVFGGVEAPDVVQIIAADCPSSTPGTGSSAWLAPDILRGRPGERVAGVMRISAGQDALWSPFAHLDWKLEDQTRRTKVCKGDNANIAYSVEIPTSFAFGSTHPLAVHAYGRDVETDQLLEHIVLSQTLMVREAPEQLEVAFESPLPGEEVGVYARVYDTYEGRYLPGWEVGARNLHLKASLTTSEGTTTKTMVDGLNWPGCSPVNPECAEDRFVATFTRPQPQPGSITGDTVTVRILHEDGHTRDREDRTVGYPSDSKVSGILLDENGTSYADDFRLVVYRDDEYHDPAAEPIRTSPWLTGGTFSISSESPDGTRRCHRCVVEFRGPSSFLATVVLDAGESRDVFVATPQDALRSIAVDFEKTIRQDSQRILDLNRFLTEGEHVAASNEGLQAVTSLLSYATIGTSATKGEYVDALIGLGAEVVGRTTSDWAEREPDVRVLAEETLQDVTPIADRLGDLFGASPSDGYVEDIKNGLDEYISYLRAHPDATVEDLASPAAGVPEDNPIAVALRAINEAREAIGTGTVHSEFDERRWRWHIESVASKFRASDTHSLRMLPGAIHSGWPQDPTAFAPPVVVETPFAGATQEILDLAEEVATWAGLDTAGSSVGLTATLLGLGIAATGVTVGLSLAIAATTAILLLTLATDHAHDQNVNALTALANQIARLNVGWLDDVAMSVGSYGVLSRSANQETVNPLLFDDRIRYEDFELIVHERPEWQATSRGYRQVVGYTKSPSEPRLKEDSFTVHVASPWDAPAFPISATIASYQKMDLDAHGNVACQRQHFDVHQIAPTHVIRRTVPAGGSIDLEIPYFALNTSFECGGGTEVAPPVVHSVWVYAGTELLDTVEIEVCGGWFESDGASVAGCPSTNVQVGSGAPTAYDPLVESLLLGRTDKVSSTRILEIPEGTLQAEIVAETRLGSTAGLRVESPTGKALGFDPHAPGRVAEELFGQVESGSGTARLVLQKPAPGNYTVRVEVVHDAAPGPAPIDLHIALESTRPTSLQIDAPARHSVRPGGATATVPVRLAYQGGEPLVDARLFASFSEGNDLGLALVHEWVPLGTLESGEGGLIPLKLASCAMPGCGPETGFTTLEVSVEGTTTSGASLTSRASVNVTLDGEGPLVSPLILQPSVHSASRPIVGPQSPISVVATDNVPLPSTTYLIEGGVRHPVTAFTYLDGATRIVDAEAFGVDAAGNIGESVPVPLFFDNDPPTVELVHTENAVAENRVLAPGGVLGVLASDEPMDVLAAGVASVHCIVTAPDGAVWMPDDCAGGFALNGDDGVYRIEFWAVDNVANEAEHQVVEVRLDATAPVAEIVAPTRGLSAIYGDDETIVSPDADGDGFADHLERAAGSDADEPLSTPLTNQVLLNADFEDSLANWMADGPATMDVRVVDENAPWSLAPQQSVIESLGGGLGGERPDDLGGTVPFVVNLTDVLLEGMGFEDVPTPGESRAVEFTGHGGTLALGQTLNASSEGLVGITLDARMDAQVEALNVRVLAEDPRSGRPVEFEAVVAAEPDRWMRHTLHAEDFTANADGLQPNLAVLRGFVLEAKISAADADAPEGFDVAHVRVDNVRVYAAAPGVGTAFGAAGQNESDEALSVVVGEWLNVTARAADPLVAATAAGVEAAVLWLDNETMDVAPSWNDAYVTWHVPTAGLDPGEHHIHVVVFDAVGHPGVVDQRIQVVASEPAAPMPPQVPSVALGAQAVAVASIPSSSAQAVTLRPEPGRRPGCTCSSPSSEARCSTAGHTPLSVHGPLAAR